MALTPYERETVIVMSDEDDLAYINTAQRPVITKLRKNPSATLLDEGRFGGTAWARFEIPKGLISFRSGKRSSRASDLQNLGSVGGSE